MYWLDPPLWSPQVRRGFANPKKTLFLFETDSLIQKKDKELFTFTWCMIHFTSVTCLILNEVTDNIQDPLNLGANLKLRESFLFEP